MALRWSLKAAPEDETPQVSNDFDPSTVPECQTYQGTNHINLQESPFASNVLNQALLL